MDVLAEVDCVEERREERRERGKKEEREKAKGKESERKESDLVYACSPQRRRFTVCNFQVI